MRRQEVGYFIYMVTGRKENQQTKRTLTVYSTIQMPLLGFCEREVQEEGMIPEDSSNSPPSHHVVHRSATVHQPTSPIFCTGSDDTAWEGASSVHQPSVLHWDCRTP